VWALTQKWKIVTSSDFIYWFAAQVYMAGNTVPPLPRSDGHETSRFLFTKWAMTAQRKDGHTT